MRRAFSSMTSTPRRSQASSSSGGGRIVRGADGVAAHLLQLRDAINPGDRPACRCRRRRGPGDCTCPGFDNVGRSMKKPFVAIERDAVRMLKAVSFWSTTMPLVSTVVTSLYKLGRFRRPKGGAGNAGHGVQLPFPSRRGSSIFLSHGGNFSSPSGERISFFNSMQAFTAFACQLSNFTCTWISGRPLGIFFLNWPRRKGRPARWPAARF